MGAINSKSPRSKRKITFSIIIAAIIIINIVTGALLFLDIQVMKSPEMIVEIDLIGINSNDAVLQTTLNIANPNELGLIVKNLEVVTKTLDETEIMHMVIEGGEISSHKNKTYTSTDHITFDGEIPDTLTTEITGIAGINFLGVLKKTLPVELKMISSIGTAIKNIAIPNLKVKGDFGEITNSGINFTTEIELDNPNPFDIQIEDVCITLKTEKDELVGNFNIEGGLIAAKSSTTLNGEGQVRIEALNAETLFVNLNTSAEVMIAGMTESLNFSTGVEIAIPHLDDFFPSSSPTEAYIDQDMKFTRQGFLNWGFTSFMTLEMINPNNIRLIVRDISFSIYRIDNGEETLIGECTVNDTEAYPENTTFIPAQIYLPMNSLFRKQGMILPHRPDGMLVVVRANITIPGLDQAFWVGVSGYQDLHLFL